MVDDRPTEVRNTTRLDSIWPDELPRSRNKRRQGQIAARDSGQTRSQAVRRKANLRRFNRRCRIPQGDLRSWSKKEPVRTQNRRRHRQGNQPGTATRGLWGLHKASQQRCSQNAALVPRARLRRQGLGIVVRGARGKRRRCACAGRMDGQKTVEHHYSRRLLGQYT